MLYLGVWGDAPQKNFANLEFSEYVDLVVAKNEFVIPFPVCQ